MTSALLTLLTDAARHFQAERAREPAETRGPERWAGTRDDWSESARVEFVKAALDAFVARANGVRGAAARVGLRSRLIDSEPRWLVSSTTLDGFGASDDWDSLPVGRPRLDGSAGDARVLLRERVGTTGVDAPGLPDAGRLPDPERLAAHLGDVVVAFASEAALDAARAEIEGLCRRLASGLRFIRAAREQDVFVEASTAIASGEPERNLRDIAALIQRELRAAGLKLYLVRREGGEPCIERRLRTDAPGETPQPMEIAGDKGFASWVVLNNDSFLLLKPAATRGTDKQLVLTGRGQLAELIGRPEPKKERNQERHLIFVPLRWRDLTLGAVSAWRDDETPFLWPDDRLTLEHVAHLLATGGRALVQSEHDQNADEVALRLGQALESAATPGAVCSALAQAAAKVAGAEAALLFLRDDQAPLHYLAAAHGIDPLRLPSPWLLPAALDRGGLKREVADRLSQAAAGRRLTAYDARPLGGAPGDAALAWLVFLGRENPWEHVQALDDEPRDHHLARFLAANDWPALERAVDALIRRASHEFDAPDDALTLDALFERACVAIHRVTGAGSVRLYTAGRGGFDLRATEPKVRRPELLPRTPGPRTRSAIRERKRAHVLDVMDERHGFAADSAGNLRQVLRALGWRDALSWLLEPIVVHGKGMGALKLLTPRGGVVLGRFEARVAAALAQRLETHLDERRRSDLQRDLEQLVDACVPLVGRRFGELRREAGRRVDDLLAQLVADGARFWALARLDGAAFTVLAASSDVPVEPIEQAVERLRSAGPFEARAPGRDLWPPGTQVCEAFVLGRASAGPLPGVFYLFSPEALVEADRIVAREAARALAWLADAERAYRETRLQMGQFRHAMLGRAQGLASAAKLLALLAAQEPRDLARIEASARTVRRQALALNRWRDNQRVYFKPFEPVLRVGPLRALVDQVVERYHEEAAVRGLKLLLEWPGKSEVVLPMDPFAIDVALSNLIHNATKYAFEGKDIVLRVEPQHDYVALSVTEEGNGIPESRREAIYQIGERAAKDQVRSIDGLGLGLPLAREIAEAHSGSLTHACVPPLREEHDTGAQTFKVTFTLRLPRR